VKHIIEAHGVTKTFNGFTAVDNISFSLITGECLGLLGPNGAGKTSTIKMTYAFSPMTSGELSVFGMDIRTHWRTIKAKIGVASRRTVWIRT
jgi:ABC-type multidrug transport system ATPase subunit